MQMEPRGKWRRVQCGSLLVTERRTVRTIATPRHSPFISRHRRMKNHCESATSVRINITKPPEGRKGRRRGGRGGGRCRASFPVRPKSAVPMTSRISHTRHSLNLSLLPLLLFLVLFRCPLSSLLCLLLLSLVCTRPCTVNRQREQMFELPPKEEPSNPYPHRSIVSTRSHSRQHNRQDRITGSPFILFSL